MEGKNKFILYSEYIETFEALSDEDAGKLIKTIFQYVNDKDPKPEGIIKLAFIPIKQNLKRDLKQWLEAKKKMSEGAKNRWNTNTNDKAPISTNKHPKDSITTESVNVNVNDNVNVINNEEKKKTVSFLKKENEEVVQKSTPKRFVKPTIEEIRAYCDERNNGIDPVKFYNYYEAVGWKIGKAPMKNWKSCIITWERKNNADTPVDNSPKINLGTNLGTNESTLGTNLGTKMGTSNLEEYNKLSINDKFMFDDWYNTNKNRLDNMGIFEKYDSISIWKEEMEKEMEELKKMWEGM